MAKVCLISCVSAKQSRSTRAEDMYISPLFRGARFFAKSRFDRWYILSAKYGLLKPSQLIEPYEKTLKKMPKKERMHWAEKVINAITPCLDTDDVLSFVAGNDYREFLLPMLSKRGFAVEVPLEGVSIGKQLSWFKKIQTEQERIAHLDGFYGLIAELEKGIGGKRTLKDCNGSMEWPRMGVYFFFENNEMRTTCIGMNRVVRVGTHSVSRGSRTTLWHRLRTHRGTNDLRGNHRGSIFRLHVGSAMIVRSKGDLEVPTWCVGQTAPQNVRKSEEELEQKVSEYIGEMPLLWLEIGDESSSISDRSYIERNAIALLSGPTGPLDLPSPRWLGRCSPTEAIQRSGLWNINYVRDAYDPRFLDVMAEYVAVTLGHRSPPEASIAPKDWTSWKANDKQLLLFHGKRS